MDKKHLTPMFTPRSIPGWILVVLGGAEKWLSRMSSLDFLYEKGATIMRAVWKLLWGHDWVLFIIGIAWLTAVAFWKDIRRWLGPEESPAPSTPPASLDGTISDAEIRGSISIFKESMDAWLEVPPGRVSGFIHIHNCSSKPIEALRFENLEVKLNGFKSLYTNYTLTLKNALTQPKGTVTPVISIDLDSDRTALIQESLPPYSLELSGNLVLRCAGREVSKVIAIALPTEVHRKEAESEQTASLTQKNLELQKELEQLRNNPPDGPEIIVEYDTDENDQHPDKPLILKNNSQQHTAYNVSVLDLPVEGKTAKFRPSLIPSIGPTGDAEVHPVVEGDTPLTRNWFYRLFASSYKDSGTEELFSPKPFNLSVAFENKDGSKKFVTECEILYTHWKKRVTIGRTSVRLDT